MDEEIENLKPTFSWEIKEIINSDSVFRQVHIAQRGSDKFPKESHFSLRENENDLSFNLKGIVSESRNYKLIGITYNKKDNFLDPTHFRLFEFPVEFLMSLTSYENISHTPKFTGAPSNVGNPNNKSHVSLYCGEFNEKTRVQLRDYCVENNNECKFNIEAINAEVNELRLRNNETPYHYYWEFDE